jgi:uncharacterized membrane protein YgcG
MEILENYMRLLFWTCAILFNGMSRAKRQNWIGAPIFIEVVSCYIHIMGPNFNAGSLAAHSHWRPMDFSILVLTLSGPRACCCCDQTQPKPVFAQNPIPSLLTCAVRERSGGADNGNHGGSGGGGDGEAGSGRWDGSGSPAPSLGGGSPSPRQEGTARA